MLNSLLSMWRKASHEHWTIPEQRSPHLLYMYKTRGILAVWLYSDIRNILTIDANFAQKQFSTRTATCGRDNKNVTVSLNMWKLKHLLSRTAISLVASRLRISGLKKIYYLEEATIFRSTFSKIFISKMKIPEANRLAWHFSIHIVTVKTASELFIYFNSVLSWLKTKWRDAVIAKTQYSQWILVKLTMLQVGLFVTWGTHDLSPEHERWHCKV